MTIVGWMVDISMRWTGKILEPDVRYSIRETTQRTSAIQNSGRPLAFRRTEIRTDRRVGLYLENNSSCHWYSYSYGSIHILPQVTAEWSSTRWIGVSTSDEPTRKRRTILGLAWNKSQTTQNDIKLIMYVNWGALDAYWNARPGWSEMAASGARDLRWASEVMASGVLDFRNASIYETTRTLYAAGRVNHGPWCWVRYMNSAPTFLEKLSLDFYFRRQQNDLLWKIRALWISLPRR